MLLFAQLAPHCWVAEVYNVLHDRRLEGRAAWTHISALRDDNMGLAFDCANCKQFKQYKKCIHMMLVQKDAHDHLIFSETYDPPCVLFKHTPPDSDGKSLSVFSASCTVHGQRGKRCFVIRKGTSATGSAWTCSACTHAHNCQHIKLSKSTLISLKVMPEWHGGEAAGQPDDEDEQQEFDPS
ncbi:hypothetical protein AURDEDRAFT_170003 [Auricularia subglabra TFB-10046 SS5]|uniref:Uncharacterized protein n=1 Tax=Auricularia subglabra (strain TFB-10046 / SS5) TaxID=717982 RepID=J0LK44_AURST|nr:hypothetical protein AURDEDRAFT_170003 [Auricularia subglabra TFB-10046 SS5]